MKRFTTSAALFVAASLALAGCGNEPSTDAASDQPTAVMTTDRAVAALIVEYVGEEPYAAHGSQDLATAAQAMGAEVQFLDPTTVDDPMEGDGVVVTAGVTNVPIEEAPDTCKQSMAAHCEITQLDDGSTMIYEWERVVPEEDPGYVSVVITGTDRSVLVYQSGPNITKDPQKMELEVPVDTMIALAQDPRLDLTTTQALVDADMPHWNE